MINSVVNMVYLTFLEGDSTISLLLQDIQCQKVFERLGEKLVSQTRLIYKDILSINVGRNHPLFTEGVKLT